MRKLEEKNANINVKKLNSLKHCVRPNRTSKTAKSHFWAWCIIMNIVLTIATIKYS